MQRTEGEVIADKVDTLIRLVDVALAENKKTQKEKIRLLTLGGLTPTSIAEILGTTTNTVKVANANMRKMKQLPRRR